MNMGQNILRKNLWDTAGRAGIALGLVSSAFLFISHAIDKIEAASFLTSIMSFGLWVLKFVSCIWLMKYFMKRFASANPEADNSSTFRMGIASAFLSALIFSAATFADAAFISADMYNEVKDVLMLQMSPLMDADTTSEMERMFESLPQYMFFSNLIYCFIYGTVLASILSRMIPSKDPFAKYKPEDQ